MLNNIGQDPAIITCDEGICSLSKEAQWQIVPQLVQYFFAWEDSTGPKILFEL